MCTVLSTFGNHARLMRWTSVLNAADDDAVLSSINDVDAVARLTAGQSHRLHM